MVPSLAAGLDVLAVTGLAKARRTVGKSRRSVSVRVCSWRQREKAAAFGWLMRKKRTFRDATAESSSLTHLEVKVRRPAARVNGADGEEPQPAHVEEREWGIK